MNDIHVIADRAMFDGAVDLIARFGGSAGAEAAGRANRSRDIGNVAHFVRWRRIERMIVVLGDAAPRGMLH